MTATGVSLIVTIAGFVVTIVSSIAIVSFKTGGLSKQVDINRESIRLKADLDDLQSIKESLAEIKGMFVLRLRE